MQVPAYLVLTTTWLNSSVKHKTSASGPQMREYLYEGIILLHIEP